MLPHTYMRRCTSLPFRFSPTAINTSRSGAVFALQLDRVFQQVRLLRALASLTIRIVCPFLDPEDNEPLIIGTMVLKVIDQPEAGVAYPDLVSVNRPFNWATRNTGALSSFSKLLTEPLPNCRIQSLELLERLRMKV